MGTKTKEKKPELLILADDAFVGGVNKGYYNEFSDQVLVGNLKFITIDEATKLRKKGELPNISNPEEEVFMLNPYTQKYFPLKEKDIERTILSDEAIAIKTALYMMGAHCIIISEDVKDLTKDNKNVKSGATYMGNGGNVDVKIKKELSVVLNTKVKVLDVNNKPQDIETIRTYLVSTGLMRNSIINSFFDTLCIKGELSSTEKIEIDFLSQLKSAVDVAANIDYGPLDANLNVSIGSIHIHKFSKSLTVYFGEVPSKIKEKFDVVD